MNTAEYKDNPPGYSTGQNMPPISKQPTMMQAAPAMPLIVPQGTPVPVNCPPGLEYLAMVDQLLIHQKVELLEAITGFETQNKYVIKNSLGQQVYFAAEISSCCSRCCCGPIRPFEMKILDNMQGEVMHFNRPLNCVGCCFPCCLQELEIFTPMGGGSPLGTVIQNWSIIRPNYSIKNSHGDVVLKIIGPIITASCCCNDVVFKIMSSDDKVQIGNITKQWSGFCKEGWTDADNFSVSFPIDLDVTVKGLLLGAVFLIDYMYFEQSQQG